MYNIVTIERKYASGGNEIGKRLAKELGYKLYDRNILLEAAKNLKIPSFQIAGLDESSPGGVLFNLSKTSLGGGSKELSMADKLFLEEERIIGEAADAGNCIIVGRAAGYILREREKSLRVFIHASDDKRLKRAMEKEGFNEAEAKNALKKNDKRRSGFYRSLTDWEWGNPKYYELYMDSGKLGMDLCVKLLAEAVKAGGK